MSPIPLRIEISYIERLLEPEMYPSDGTSDLPCHECLTTDRRFMIKKKTITSEYTIALTIIHCDPVTIELRYSIGTPRMKWRCFCISFFWHIVPDSSEHLGGGCLVEFCFFLQSVHSYRLEKTKRPNAISIGRILWHLETHMNM